MANPSVAWLELGPHRSNPSVRKSQVYLPLSPVIVDILIDAAEDHFQNRGYNNQNIEVFCKNFLRRNNYTFLGSDCVIQDVKSYFQKNRDKIIGAREKYEQLPVDIGIDARSLPGGVCNKVDYILLYLGVQEHYELYRDSLSVGENLE